MNSFKFGTSVDGPNGLYNSEQNSSKAVEESLQYIFFF